MATQYLPASPFRKSCACSAATAASRRIAPPRAWEIWRRYGGDAGEIWGRCGGDTGEIYGALHGAAARLLQKRGARCAVRLLLGGAQLEALERVQQRALAQRAARARLVHLHGALQPRARTWLGVGVGLGLGLGVGLGLGLGLGSGLGLGLW